MISLFIIMVITIAAASALGFGILSLIKSAETALLVQRNQVRMDTVVNTVRSYVRVDGGRVFVPVSSGGSGYEARVPPFSPFSTTTWGKPIVYCPVGREAVTAANANIVNRLNASSSETYPVEVTNVGGVQYVRAGGPGNAALNSLLRNRNVVALLISPDPSGTDLPRCSNVQLGSDNSTFIVNGGSVVAAYFSPDQNGSSRQLIFSPSGTPPSDAPAGAQVVSSIEDAASAIVGLGLSDTTIRMLAGDNVVPVDDMSKLVAASAGRTIRIVGDSGARLLVEHESAPAGNESVLKVDGVMEVSDIEVKGVIGDGGTAGDEVDAADVGFAAGPTGRLSMHDVVLGLVRNFGGDVSLLQNVSVRPSYSATARKHPISGAGGRIFVDGNSPSLVVSATADSGVYVRGGDVTVYGEVGMTVAPTGEGFWSDGGGRVLPATQLAAVRINGAAATPVQSSVTFGAKESEDPEPVALSENGAGRSLVASPVQTCADGSDNCSATCPGESVVAWGECSSSNGFPLAGFGADATGRTWTCRWSAPSTAAAPAAKAICGKLP